MARERGLTVNVAGFEKLMNEQRDRDRADHARRPRRERRPRCEAHRIRQKESA